MKKVTTPYIYGKSPNPTNWHEAAEALKNGKQDKQSKRKSSGVMDRLSHIENLLKAGK